MSMNLEAGRVVGTFSADTGWAFFFKAGSIGLFSRTSCPAERGWAFFPEEVAKRERDNQTSKENYRRYVENFFVGFVAPPREE